MRDSIPHILKHRRAQFKRVFGLNLDMFMSAYAGFDTAKFLDMIGYRGGDQEEFIQRTYGFEGVSLYRRFHFKVVYHIGKRRLHYGRTQN